MENTRVLISAIGQTVVVNVHGFLLLYLPCSQTGLLVVLAFYILEWPKPSVLHGICLQSFCFVLVFFFSFYIMHGNNERHPREFLGFLKHFSTEFYEGALDTDYHSRV